MDNATVLTDTIVTDGSLNDKLNKIGKTISSTSSAFTIAVAFSRNPSQDIHFRLNFALLEVSSVFDSVNQCCASSCPSGTGLNVKANPYTCVSCNSSSGQFYNPVTAQCECSSGYYLLSTLNQVCTPCQAPLCAVCNPQAPSVCQTCLSGAQLQWTGECICNSGLVAVNNSCTSCSHKCSGCDSTGKCLSCSDSKRDLTKSCNCIDGFYDNLQSTCLACNSNCKTCSSSNVCTSCEIAENKRL